ncbi:hypothetical protein HNQ91_002429 [Filimonas zeae]|uniref:Uncharacterized protein n=1 Tax=Filimonas zeae TaxID=1737353 RepID=A0A917ITH7_9BACT|nr:hypothetical protein [Filimonas zeae]MDR6339378.1 hypothetical protein [Filimonas zeae]GGH63866.1 hypothetical protein GCM10011379_15260 [Filimonas zeae]
MPLNKLLLPAILLLCCLPGINLAQTSWTGAVSSAWNVSANWTAGVPTAAVDAFVGNAAFTGGFQPVVSSNAACRTLTVGDGVVNITLTQNKGLTVAGDFILSAGAAFAQKSNNLTVKGNWNNSGTYTTTNNNAKVNLAGVVQRITGGSITAFRKLTIGTGSTVTLGQHISVAGALAVSGMLVPEEASGTWQVTGNGSVTVSADGVLTVTAATYAANYPVSGTVTLAAGSTVAYAGTADQTIRNNLTYSTLRVSGGGTKTAAGNLNALNSTTAAAGRIEVLSGTLNLAAFTANRGTAVTGGSLVIANNATLKIGGTNTLPAAFNTRSYGLTSTVEYNGAGQTVAAEAYGNLTLSGSTGAVVKTMPATSFVIAGNFSSNAGTATSVSYTAAAGISVEGNVAIGAATTFNGGSFVHNISGNWVNNGTFTGAASTVSFVSGGSTISGTGIHNFFHLNFGATNITAAASSSITVAGNLSTSGPGTFTHGAGGTFTLSGASRTITGQGITLDNLSVTGNVAAATTVTLTGNLAVSGSYNGTDGRLNATGTGKTLSGAGTLVFGTLSVSGTVTTAVGFTVNNTLEVQGSFTASAGTAIFTGTALLNGTANLFNVTVNGTSLQLSSNAVLGIAGTYTLSSGTLNVGATRPNTVNYNGAGAQNITAGTYDNLLLSNGGTKTAAGAVTVNSDVTIAVPVTFNAGNFVHNIAGNWVNNGSFTASGSTVTFSGSANTSIAGNNTFNTLTVNKSAAATTITLTGAVSVTTLTMTAGTVKTGSNILTITGNRSGNGIVLGNIKHQHLFVPGVAYAYEGPDNTLAFVGVTTASWIMISVATGPVSDFPQGASINRVYTVSSNTIIDLAIVNLRLHYEDAELNGNTESAMGLWKNTGTGWVTSGKTGSSTAANYVEQTSLSGVVARWTLSDNANVVRWNGSVSSSWTNAANWTSAQGTPSLPPGSNDIVELGTAAFVNQPVISTNVTVKSISFGSAQAVSLSLAAGALTVQGNITGSWAANTTHSIQTGAQNMTVNGDLVLSDGVNGHSIQLNAGAGTITIGGSLQLAGDASFTCTGLTQVAIGSNFQYSGGTFSAGNSTVTYNGTGTQTVAGVNYYHLAVNKSQGTALSSNAVTVQGNVNVQAGELELNNNTTIAGDITIAAGALLRAGNTTISVAGNWAGGGSFMPGSSTVAFTGAGTQNIAAFTFNNVTINKPGAVATLTGNIVLNGNLVITSGTFNMATYTASRSAAGGLLSMAAGTTLLTGASGGFPAGYASYSLAATSTVHYNGTVAQPVAGITYGHLNISNSGTKTLAAGCTVNGDVVVATGSVLNAAAYTMALYGNWNNSGSFVPGTGTVTLNGTAKSVTGNTTFNRLTIYGSYAVAGSDIVYNTLLLIATGGSFDGGSGSATINGDLTNNGALVSNGVTTFSGAVKQTIRFVNAVTANSGGVINFNGTVSPVLNSTSAPVFATLNINNTAGVNPSVGWLVGVACNISSGAVFNGGAVTHTMLGSFTNNGTVTSSGILYFNPSTAQHIQLAGTAFTSTGTVILGGTAALAVSGTAAALNHVTITNTAGVTPAGGLTVNGNFSISSNGIFNAGSNTYMLNGNLESNGTLQAGTSQFVMAGANAEFAASTNTVFYDFTVNGGLLLNTDCKVARNFTNNGTVDAAAGALSMVGATTSVISGTAASFALAQLDISKDAGVTATLARSLTGITDAGITSGILDAVTYTLTQDAAGGSLTIEGNARLIIRGTNTLPVFSTYNVDTLSTVEYAGGVQAVSAATPYGNLVLSAAGNKTAAGILHILNDFTLSNGNFIAGNYADTLRGNWNMTGGTYIATGNTFVLAGAKPQNINTLTAFNNLTVYKAGSVVTLSSQDTVTGTLRFIAGRIKTGNYKVILPAGAVVTGAAQATGWVYGKVQKYVTSGTAVARTFETGDSLYYTPVSLTLATVTAAGYVAADCNNTDHPNATAGNMNTAKSINRYWSLVNAGITFTTATVGVNWAAADVDAGVTVANLKVYLYNGSAWVLPSTSGITAVSAQGNAITVLGAIAVGELIVPNTWTGLAGTNWHTTGNWSLGFVPLTNTDVIIPSGVTNYPLVSADTAYVKNLTLAAAATLTINGNVLKISGLITSNGSVLAGNGGVEMNGTAAQTIPAALFGSNQLKNLVINNTAGVTLAGSLQIGAMVKVTAGTFHTAGFLTLLSTAAQTAFIDGSGAGEVTGNVTMQRYLASSFGYKYISSPFQAATVNELADDINLSASFPSLYRYEENQTTSGWVNYTNTAGVLNPLHGYAAFTGTATTPKTITMAGVVNNGNITATFYNNNRTYTQGFQLVGNPYPSPVNWDEVGGWVRNNIDNAVYFFSAGTTDAYSGTYSSYINGVSSNGIAGSTIAAMQGFFVHVSDGAYPVTGSLTVKNQARVAGTNASFYRKSNARGGDEPLIRLSAAFEGGAAVPDGLVVYLDDSATAAFDKEWDALKMMNTAADVPNVYNLTPDGQQLSINGMPLPDTSVSIPLGCKVEKAGTIQLKLNGSSHWPAGMYIYLRDKATGTLHDMWLNNTYKVTLAAGTYESRFALVFSRTSLSGGNGNQQPPVVTPAAANCNAQSDGVTITASYQLPAGIKGSLVVTNIMGQVMSRQDISGADKVSFGGQWAAGVYIVAFYYNGERHCFKLLTTK